MSPGLSGTGTGAARVKLHSRQTRADPYSVARSVPRRYAPDRLGVSLSNVDAKRGVWMSSAEIHGRTTRTTTVSGIKYVSPPHKV